MHGYTESYAEKRNLIETERQSTTPSVGLIIASFLICVDDVLHNWQMKRSEHFMIGNSGVDTLLFADDQAALSNSESVLQMAICTLSTICKDFRLQISTL